MVASAKNDIRRILQTTFSELEQLVDVLCDTMLYFLRVPSLIRQARRQWQKASSEGDGGRGISVHYTKIIDLARISVATTSPSKELILPGKIETLFHLNARVKEIARMLVKLCKSIWQEEFEILTSIRGIAAKTAAPFIASYALKERVH
jgi:hypothetical protein